MAGRGLHIRTSWDGEETLATLTPDAKYTAIPGCVYGGLPPPSSTVLGPGARPVRWRGA